MSTPHREPAPESSTDVGSTLFSEESVRSYAQLSLGPESRAFLETDQARLAVKRRMEAGSRLDDAVLGEIHSHLRTAPRKVADEFVWHFFLAMKKAGSRALPHSSGLRRLTDTVDLLDSVICDTWESWAELRFSTRGEFLALLNKRVGWKAKTKVRHNTAQSRSEDRRVAMPEEHDLPVADRADQHPVERSIKREELEQIARIASRMSHRDAQILVLLREGATTEDLAAHFGITPATAERARSRALQAARKLLGKDKSQG